MKTLWITGASGTVGTKLVQYIAWQGKYDKIYAFTHEPATVNVNASTSTTEIIWSALDIGDRTAVYAAAEAASPDIIINSAAITNVDVCEIQKQKAFRVNADGPRYLAEISKQHNTHFIHISTDYVFSGSEMQPGPYHEKCIPNPINYYGQTKLRGEYALQEVCGSTSPYTIVRTALVYGAVSHGRTNFLTWLVSELIARRHVRINYDLLNTPTLIDDLINILIWIVDHGITGIYHVAGPDLVSRREWAMAIVKHFGLDKELIEWVSTIELAQIAVRPQYGGLRCERLEHDSTRGAPQTRGIIRGLVEIDWKFDLSLQ